MKKRVGRRIEAMALSLVMVFASVALMPALKARAATTKTIDYAIMGEDAGTATVVTDFDYTMGEQPNAFMQCMGKVEQVAENDPQYQSNQTILQHMDSGYDEVWCYAIDIDPVFVTGRTEEGVVDATVTFPLLSGYTKQDGYDARIIYVYDFITDGGATGYPVSIKPLAITDTTITFKMPFGLQSMWVAGSLGIKNHFWVEYKKHTHTLPNEWKSDDTNHWKVCSVCGDIDAKAAHTYDEGKITTPATYSAAGVKTYTCTVCGHQKTETIPMLVAVAGAEVVTTDTKASYEVAKVNADGTVEVAYTGNNTNAKKVKVPDTVVLADGTTAAVTEVADGAFKNDKKVTTVTLGKNVETIGKNAFSGNTNLKKVTLGKNVTTIGKNAFSGDKKLQTITIKSSKVKKIGKNAFKNVENTTIKVPAKKVKKYTQLVQKSGASSSIKVTKK
ncbi:MAG: leucine-rich repeat domain-containing protein [Lachnospiraceae bacterium]|nr:leucine-rich repeat domain-containing protein [Lachnospiraceae bacterium]